MPNLLAPSAIIMLNPEINNDILNAVKRQLFIDEVIDGAELDKRINEDGYYSQTVHQSGKRVLVIRSFQDPMNRSAMDVVLFYANGLLSVKKNVFQAPPQASFPINSAYLSQILIYSPASSS